MRYFVLIFGLSVLVIMAVAGKRGSLSRNPPIEVFPDMDRQAKLRPQVPNQFFANGRSSQLPVVGTIARTTPYENLAGGDATQPVFPFDDAPVNTGRITGTTNFVETNPMQITSQFMARGQQRFQIYCLPCHGPLADGNGVTKKLGMALVANLHDARIVRLTDGEIFDTITQGSKTLAMGPYGPIIPIQDRWAIVSYLRALQLSRLASIDDVPEQQRSALK
jgi:hypothetical protein